MTTLNLFQRIAARSARVQAVLRAVALAPPGYRRGLDRLWIDEPDAKGWPITLASWVGFLDTRDIGPLRPYRVATLTDAGRAALATEVRPL